MGAKRFGGALKTVFDKRECYVALSRARGQLFDCLADFAAVVDFKIREFSPAETSLRLMSPSHPFFFAPRP